jgi:hypothetical protein
MIPKFYVHIVESPSPQDLFEGRTEGQILKSFLDLSGIPCEYCLVVDKSRLEEALTSRVLEAVNKHDAKPILHFSCHGNENGIQLTNQSGTQEYVPWENLAEWVALNNKQFDGIGVCMSSCSGLTGKKMAHVIDPRHVPMHWIVGTSKKFDYPDGALAFCAFYRGFQKDVPMDKLLPSIRIASGIDDFDIAYGAVAHSEYLKDFQWQISNELFVEHARARKFPESTIQRVLERARRPAS